MDKDPRVDECKRSSNLNRSRVSNNQNRLVASAGDEIRGLTHKTGLPYLSMITDLKGRCVRRACLLIVERIPCSCSAKLLMKKKVSSTPKVLIPRIRSANSQSHELAVRRMYSVSVCLFKLHNKGLGKTGWH